MMDNKIQETFDSIIRGDLSPKELEEFKRKLGEDEELKRQFNIYKEGINAIKLEGFSKEVTSLINSEKSKHVRFLPIVMGIAASLIIIFTYFIVIIPFNKMSNSDLFIAYYEPYPNILIDRSTEKIDEALIYYSEGKHQIAKSIFRQNNNLTDEATFYLALSYLSLNNPDSALLYLKKIGPGNIFNEQIRWYKGMALLLTGESEASLVIFQQIKPDEYMYTDAKILIKKLE